MSWIDKLEHKFGRRGIPNLTMYMVICYVLGYLLNALNPSLPVSYTHLAFANYFLAMLKGGVHLAPSQFEAMFLSDAHSEEVIQQTLKVFAEVVEKGEIYE